MTRRDSRALIVSAARAEFAEHGFAGGRVNRIARRAGVNKQLIFYYFGSKEALYQAVVERAAGEAQPAPAAAASGTATELRRVFTSFFDTLAANPSLARLMVLDAQQPGSATAGQRGSARAIGELLSSIRALVARGQGIGHYRDDIDPDQTARQAAVLALGYFALAPILDGPPETRRAAKWRDGAIDLLMRSLAW